MSKEYVLGKELDTGDEKYRIVRIIEHSHSLHTDEKGKEFILDESYIELKGIKGDIEFVVLHSEMKPYTGEVSKITAPAQIPWKRGE